MAQSGQYPVAYQYKNTNDEINRRAKVSRVDLGPAVVVHAGNQLCLPGPGASQCQDQALSLFDISLAFTQPYHPLPANDHWLVHVLC